MLDSHKIFIGQVFSAHQAELSSNNERFNVRICLIIAKNQGCTIADRFIDFRSLSTFWDCRRVLDNNFRKCTEIQNLESSISNIRATLSKTIEDSRII
jgi:hypothetical protein